MTDRAQRHEPYMPMNSTESPANRLTASHTDPVTQTPAYKDTSVEMRVLAEMDKAPLKHAESLLAVYEVGVGCDGYGGSFCI